MFTLALLRCMVYYTTAQMVVCMCVWGGGGGLEAKGGAPVHMYGRYNVCLDYYRV